MDADEIRGQICKSLGISNLKKLYEIVQKGASLGADFMLRNGLNAKTLISLGYTEKGMRALGFSSSVLYKMGYTIAGKTTSAGINPEENPDNKANHQFSSGGLRENIPHETRVHNGAHPHYETHAYHDHNSDDNKKNPRDLVKSGYTANQLRQLGINAHHCKVAGVTSYDMNRIGFTMEELITEFGGYELKKIGYSPAELKRYYKGPELKEIGYSAHEMRVAGFTVRELLNFGYNENHIVAAGFSVQELVREGLSRYTVDKTRLDY